MEPRISLSSTCLKQRKVRNSYEEEFLSQATGKQDRRCPTCRLRCRPRGHSSRLLSPSEGCDPLGSVPGARPDRHVVRSGKDPYPVRDRSAGTEPEWQEVPCDLPAGCEAS